MEVYLQSFFTSALIRDKRPASRPWRFTPGKHPTVLIIYGPQCQSGHFREETHLCPLSTIEPRFFGCLARGLAAAIVLSSYFTAGSCTMSYHHEVFLLPELCAALIKLASNLYSRAVRPTYTVPYSQTIRCILGTFYAELSFLLRLLACAVWS
jgi:hypothetical protein